MITVKLKDRKFCSNKKWLGEIRWSKKDKVEIVISTTMNKNPVEFFLSLIHELLHLWVSVMRINGVKIKNEHKFIYSVENGVVSTFRRVIGGNFL